MGTYAGACGVAFSTAHQLRMTDEESEMLETALRTLTREIALAEGRDPLQVRSDIEGILDR